MNSRLIVLIALSWPSQIGTAVRMRTGEAMPAQTNDKRKRGKQMGHAGSALGNAPVSGAGDGVPRSRTSPEVKLDPAGAIQEKFVALEQRDQHTRRVRYPDDSRKVERFFGRGMIAP